MPCEFDLIQITLSKERIENIDNRTRKQFIGCMHAHNEIAFLSRLLRFTMNAFGEGDLHDDAQIPQLWCVMLLLAGKINEAWALINERFLKAS